MRDVEDEPVGRIEIRKLYFNQLISIIGWTKDQVMSNSFRVPMGRLLDGIYLIKKVNFGKIKMKTGELTLELAVS